jgi:hypothetical protein
MWFRNELSSLAEVSLYLLHRMLEEGKLHGDMGFPSCKWLHFLGFRLLWCRDTSRVMASSFLRFLDHTITHNDAPQSVEWSARRWDLYLKTHNTHNRQTSITPVGFEPTISAGERTQTYTLDRAATGIKYYCSNKFWCRSMPLFVQSCCPKPL